MAKEVQPHPFLVELGKNIERLSNAMELQHHYQMAEANKVADSYTTVNGITVPDPTQITPFPTQIVPGRDNRKTVILSNTGTHACTVSNTPDHAMTGGFTIAAGAQLTIETQEAIFGWVGGGNTTTVDVLETLFDLQRAFKPILKTNVHARYDDSGTADHVESDDIGPVHTDANTGIDEIQWRDTNRGT